MDQDFRYESMTQVSHSNKFEPWIYDQTVNITP
jgi:hypothetical protein